MIILPYAKTSISSKRLAKELGCRRIAVRRNTYKHPSMRKVLNWGYSGSDCATRWCISPMAIVNLPHCVKNASNKLKCFKTLNEAGCPTLGYTTSQQEAQQALDNMEAHSIYCRHLLSSSGGNGIEIIEHGETVPEAPLYTFGLYKWTEWRFHQGKEGVISIQQKVKRGSGGQAGEDMVRNHSADYIFKRHGLNVPEGGIKAASDAIGALGLDFAALDMAHTPDGWKVIEVNTAPGLTGSTIKDYGNYFRRLLS